MLPSSDEPRALRDPPNLSPCGGLRVLLVTDEMEVGGTQRQIVNLACGLQALGVEVTVMYFRSRSFLVDELQRQGIRVVHCPKQGAVDLMFICTLAHLVRSGRYDVVHAFAFSAELWAAVALLLAGAARRPALVSSVRGTYDWYSRLQWQLKAWVSERSTAVVANSCEGARFAAQRIGAAAARMQVVYNGIRHRQVPAVDRARAAQHWPGVNDSSGALRLLFVGRLVDIKGVDTLIEAIALLPLADFSLVLCGDGPLRDNLHRQAHRQGVASRIRFMGERSDAAAFVAACDVLVLPSRQEGLSNALLEAMAAGRAVVASRVGGNTELVDNGCTGLHFESGDANGLAAALRQLRQEPAVRERLGQQAAAFVDERFAVPAMAGAMHQLYRAAARKTSPEEPLSAGIGLRVPATTASGPGFASREH